MADHVPPLLIHLCYGPYLDRAFTDQFRPAVYVRLDSFLPTRAQVWLQNEPPIYYVDRSRATTLCHSSDPLGMAESQYHGVTITP